MQQTTALDIISLSRSVARPPRYATRVRYDYLSVTRDTMLFHLLVALSLSINGALHAAKTQVCWISYFCLLRLIFRIYLFLFGLILAPNWRFVFVDFVLFPVFCSFFPDSVFPIVSCPCLSPC